MVREWPGAKVIESCSIIVTDANKLVRPVHDRMPVILDPGDQDTWLDPHRHDDDDLLPLLKSYPAELMDAYPVSRRVSNPVYDDPECASPVRSTEA